MDVKALAKDIKKGISSDSVLYIFIFVYLLVIVNLTISSPDSLYKSYVFYGAIIVAPIIFSIIYGIRNFKTDFSTTLLVNKRLFGLIFSFLLIIGVISAFDLEITSYLSTFLMWSMVGFAAVLMVKIFESYVYSLDGWSGIIMRLIFFIPCLLSDLFDFIVGEFAASPLVVYVILGLELTLFAFYKLYPYIMKNMDTGIKLFPDNVINIKEQISLLKTETKLKSLSSYNTEYENSRTKDKAFWFWVYVVDMPSNVHPYNEETYIFRINNESGEKQRNSVTYKNGLCRVYLGSDTFVEFKIPTQKWVNIVLQDQLRQYDVFMNGTLVATKQYYNRVQPKPTDYIVLGQNDGIQGGITNVKYFPYFLGKPAIERFYEEYKDTDPPI